MNPKREFINLNINLLDHRPTLNGKVIWDGTFHGDTDPVGPIGGGGLDVSNGF